MSKLKYPEWQTPYREALLESDKKKLEAKIHLNHQEENAAIADALNTLRSLKFGSVNYPDWNAHELSRH